MDDPIAQPFRPYSRQFPDLTGPLVATMPDLADRLIRDSGLAEHERSRLLANLRDSRPDFDPATDGRVLLVWAARVRYEAEQLRRALTWQLAVDVVDGRVAFPRHDDEARPAP